MNTQGNRAHVCTICDRVRQPGETWFLVTESRWQDRLKVLHWQNRLAEQASLYPVCSAAHVQELVVHWMTAGSLEYPFARVSSESPRIGWRRLLQEHVEVDISEGELLGELAVHRDSMRRVLRDSPQSLGVILSALVSALERDKLRASRLSLEPEEESLAVTHEA